MSSAAASMILLVGVEPAVGVILLHGYIGDMEHHIGGVQCGGPPEVRPVQVHAFPASARRSHHATASMLPNLYSSRFRSSR